jgi:hypothetical protein
MKERLQIGPTRLGMPNNCTLLSLDAGTFDILRWLATWITISISGA